MKQYLVITIALVVACGGAILSKEPLRPSPRVAATLKCSAEGADGTSFSYPGNGTTMKPRLEMGINCWIAIPKIPAGKPLKGSLKAKGKARIDEPTPRPDDSYSIDAAFTEGDGDFTACESFTVSAELKSGGKIVWQGRLAINQDCPD